MNARTKKIATVALNRAVAGDMEDAAGYVRRLTGDELVYAIQAWIDTFIHHVYPEAVPGRQVHLSWAPENEDRAETADEVDPAYRWGGRLISARAAMDEDQFFAVLYSVPQGRELGTAIGGLLGMIAVSINQRDRVRRLSAEASGGQL